jgi:two-component system chemotaxis sensor kinase CheA
MVPLGQVFDKLARIVRQLGREHEKSVRLAISGADTEVDKLIVEELSDPLMHLVRNAIAHGIEPPTQREITGKNGVGTIALTAYQKGSHVVIEVEDDGRGIDPDLLCRRAVERDLITREQASELSLSERLNLVFLPGLSTRDEVTELSGRGVGMDVVRTNIAQLGGMVDLHSELMVGTKIAITLPITLAIIRALIVRVADERYAIPLATIQEAIRLEPRDVQRVNSRPVLDLRGKTIQLCPLDELFQLSSAPPGTRRFVVVSAMGERCFGLVVDELLGQQDVVIKPLPPSLKDVPGFAGAADVGEQRVALILDTPTILAEMSGSGPGLLAGTAS